MDRSDIQELRNRIDDIDREILDLLNKRMTVSEQIGVLKAQIGRDVIDTTREGQILRKLVSMNTGPLPEKTLRGIYREIFSGSRAVQSPVTVAFLGPEGTYTHEAALERFGHSASYIPCSNVAEVFREVEQAGSRFGVVPVENSIEGSVRATLDELMASSVGACGEISLQISHALVNRSGKLEDVRKVVSHPQALAQCRRWLAARLPGISLEEASSTAVAAEQAMKDPSTAAVANERVSVRLGLQVVRRGIQDRSENITRFLVLGSLSPDPTGRDKTSIVFWTEDRPGSLFKILEKFAAYELNLSRILSRPDPGAMPWKYAFFVDLEGHRDDPKVAKCLKELATRDTMVKILGSFPIHSLPSRE
ncbi:MAG: prephenate dehydratase [Desulfomonilaceae bacterium]|nr:prephenate dehydratase [Desulfomonilaceae bacterium]